MTSESRQLFAQFAQMNAVIQKIYVQKDYEHYRRLASQPYFHLPDEIVEFARENDVQIEGLHEINSQFLYPASEWTFTFPEVRVGECPTSFSTYFAVSKICEVFFIQHFFQLQDVSPQSPIATSYLDGTGHSEQPITYLQYELENRIKDQMEKNRFFHLTVQESRFVVFGLRDEQLAEYFHNYHNDTPEEYFQVDYFRLLFRDTARLLN